ncbi:unnamed protein product [Amoebophrya sp. A120]|nr:unnamed protein product [Amoebophrya sp. A120]|eukprot:GSA120T00002409001.1
MTDEKMVGKAAKKPKKLKGDKTPVAPGEKKKKIKKVKKASKVASEPPVKDKAAVPHLQSQPNKTTSKINKSDGKPSETPKQTSSSSAPPPPADGAPKKQILFAGNLGYDCTAADLRKLLQGCNVKDIRLLTDPKTKDPRGCGFVEFATGGDLQKGLKYHHRTLGGRKIRLELPGSGSSKEKRDQTVQQRRQELGKKRKSDFDKRQMSNQDGDETTPATKPSSKAKNKPNVNANKKRKRNADHTTGEQTRPEIVYYDHPTGELERLRTKFRLNDDGVNYLKRNEAWLLESIDQFCRIPDKSIKDPTGWMIKFGNQLRKERATGVTPRLHPVFEVPEEDRDAAGKVDFNPAEVKFGDEIDLPGPNASVSDEEAGVLPDDILSDVEEPMQSPAGGASARPILRGDVATATTSTIPSSSGQKQSTAEQAPAAAVPLGFVEAGTIVEPRTENKSKAKKGFLSVLDRIERTNKKQQQEGKVNKTAGKKKMKKKASKNTTSLEGQKS